MTPYNSNREDNCPEFPNPKWEILKFFLKVTTNEEVDKTSVL
jgi:hypothetical protein